MKYLTIAAVVTTLAFAPVAMAQQAAAPAPANKADCEKAKMKWDDKGGKDAKGACVSGTTAAPAAKPADVKK